MTHRRSALVPSIQKTGTVGSISLSEATTGTAPEISQLLFIQAFPMSFSIFWRLALVMPVLLIGLFIYGFIGGLLGLLIGLLFPVMSFFITFLVSASSAVIPALFGTRYGLHSMDIPPSNGIKGLIFPALAYGAVEGIGATLVIGLSLGLLLLFSSSDFAQLADSAELAPQFLEPAFFAPILVVLLICLLGICAIRACLLVPIASASVGRDPDGMKYTPFRHFGSAFGPLFALVILSYVGMIIIYCGIMIAIFATGTVETLAAETQELTNMINGRVDIRPLWTLIWLTVIYILVGFWAFSVQCAGGVLGYLKLGDGRSKTDASLNIQASQKPSPPPIAKSGPKMSNEDLRALRKSREFRD